MVDFPEPRIITRPSFLVAGMLYLGKNENDEIPALWKNEFLPQVEELAHLRPDQDYHYYGLERMLPDTPVTGIFEYYATLQVSSIDKLPVGMVGVEVPEQTYAVLPANGIPDIGRVWDYLHSTWLAQSHDLELADGYSFEHYPPTFPKDNIIYIHVSIQTK
jgi:AraC family transcriptional regulator